LHCWNQFKVILLACTLHTQNILCLVSVCVKLHIIVGHAHLYSRTDSRALQAEYCIVDIPHNTAI